MYMVSPSLFPPSIALYLWGEGYTKDPSHEFWEPSAQPQEKIQKAESERWGVDTARAWAENYV